MTEPENELDREPSRLSRITTRFCEWHEDRFAGKYQADSEGRPVIRYENPYLNMLGGGAATVKWSIRRFLPATVFGYLVIGGLILSAVMVKSGIPAYEQHFGKTFPPFFEAVFWVTFFVCLPLIFFVRTFWIYILILVVYGALTGNW